MLDTNRSGRSHVYLDEKIDGFSNLAVGIAIQAIGQGLRVAYVDIEAKATKFTNFIENLSLSYSFVRRFDRFSLNIYSFKGQGKVSKTFIPQVEFSTLNEELFWKSLDDYDLIVFDNVSLTKVSRFAILNYLKAKNKQINTVFIVNNEKDFNEIRENFEFAIKYNYRERKNLTSMANIVDITGEGKGKSAYGFGHLIRCFINKQDVKLIYFDKGSEFYGEMKFFEQLKKWSKENSLYGKFDFVVTGNQIRDSNPQEDIREAKEGLMLLKTAMKKQTPVIADELNTAIKKGFLQQEAVIDLLKNVDNEVVITGANSPKEILDMSHMIVNTEDLK